MSAAAVQTPVLTRIVETVVIIALELALQRALGPLWPKRCGPPRRDGEIARRHAMT